MSFIDAPDFDDKARERDSTVPRFFMESVQDNAASEKEGRPIYRDVEMVEINIPADRLTQVVRLVTDEHRRRWPKAYEAFKANAEQPVDGTPIDQLPGITKSMVEELRYFHIRTIETGANLTDDQMGKLGMMGRSLRDRCQRWVRAAEGNAQEEKLAAENRELRDNMSLMEKQMADMRAQMDKLAAAVGSKGDGEG